MELNIRKLREIIAQILGPDLIKDGFKLDKSLTWFTKKNGKNKLKIFVNCYDYRPSKIEFRLILQIWVDEIVKETEKFHVYLNELFYKEWPTFSFSEGDFYRGTKGLDHKFRNAYAHIITDVSEMENEVFTCKELLVKEILPSLKEFMDLQLFQEYVVENYKTIGESTLTKASLIALKLKGEKELRLVSNYYWEVNKFKNMGSEDIFRKYAENIVPYYLSDLE